MVSVLNATSAAKSASLAQRLPSSAAHHKVGDIDLRIPKLYSGSFLPSILEPYRREDQALYAVVMEAYVSGVSTRKVDALVAALVSQSGISKSQVSRIGNCQERCHCGQAMEISRHRTVVNEKARLRHPSRWSRSTRCSGQTEVVWINHPPNDINQAQQLPLMQAAGTAAQE